ncbi:MAG: hypothetical protein HYW90_03330 [Candidatus Sungbacteria bacterium]|nr:hypothetical protein [Candidatus Sungbacteria bacterium]
MRAEDKARYEIWRKETLAAVTSDVSAGCGGFCGDMKEFNVFITALGRRAVVGFMRVFGFATEAELDRMDPELKHIYALEIVSALNAGLPLGYPFIVVLILSNGMSRFRVGVLARKVIPGAHDLVTRGIIPILRIKNTLTGAEAGLNLRNVEIECFTPGDGLEEAVKL